MKRAVYSLVTIVSVVGSVLVGCSSTQTSVSPAQAEPQAQTSPGQLRDPDVVYVPTPTQVVDRMFAIANVNSKDVLYAHEIRNQCIKKTQNTCLICG